MAWTTPDFSMSFINFGDNPGVDPNFDFTNVRVSLVCESKDGFSI